MCWALPHRGEGVGGLGDIMTQMGPMIAQMLGGGAAGPGAAPPAASAAGSGPAERPRSAPLPGGNVAGSVCPDTGNGGVRSRTIGGGRESAPAALRMDTRTQTDIEAALPAADAQRWLDTMATDAGHMAQQGGERRPLSAAYAAGGLHTTPTSSQRLL